MRNMFRYTNSPTISNIPQKECKLVQQTLSKHQRIAIYLENICRNEAKPEAQRTLSSNQQ